MNRRRFIKTGLIFVPVAAKAQGFLLNPYRFSTGGGGGSPVTISDAFGGTLSNWTVQSGTNTADVNAGEMRLVTGSFGEIFYTHNTSLNTTDQYIKIRMATGATGSNRWTYLIFRFTDSTSPFYYLEIGHPDFACQWYRRASVGGAATAIGSSFDLGSIANTTTTLGAMVSGSGTSVEFRTWVNPTGNAPDTGATTWGGAAAGNTKTDDPASPVDSGNKIGLGGTQQTANSLHMDDFFGGDKP